MDDVLRLVLAGARLAAEPGVTGQELDRVVDRLLVRDPAVDSAGHVDEVLCGLLPGLWEGGWQPADVAHAVRRKVSARAGRLVAAVITAQASAAGAAERAPRAWTAQLGELAGAERTVAGWWRAEGIAAAAGWRDVLRVVGLLRGLPRLEQLLPALGLDRGGAGRPQLGGGGRLPGAQPDPRAAGQGRVHRVRGRGRGVDRQGAGADGPARHRHGDARVSTRRRRRRSCGAGPPAAPRRPARGGQGRDRAGRRVGERGAGGAAAGVRHRHAGRDARRPGRGRAAGHLAAAAGRPRAGRRGAAGRVAGPVDGLPPGLPLLLRPAHRGAADRGPGRRPHGGDRHLRHRARAGAGRPAGRGRPGGGGAVPRHPPSGRPHGRRRGLARRSRRRRRRRPRRLPRTRRSRRRARSGRRRTTRGRGSASPGRSGRWRW